MTRTNRRMNIMIKTTSQEEQDDSYRENLRFMYNDDTS